MASSLPYQSVVALCQAWADPAAREKLKVSGSCFTHTDFCMLVPYLAPNC